MALPFEALGDSSAGRHRQDQPLSPLPGNKPPQPPRIRDIFLRAATNPINAAGGLTAALVAAVKNAPSALHEYAYDTLPQAYTDMAKITGMEAELGVPMSDAPADSRTALSAMELLFPETQSLAPLGAARLTAKMAEPLSTTELGVFVPSGRFTQPEVEMAKGVDRYFRETGHFTGPEALPREEIILKPSDIKPTTNWKAAETPLRELINNDELFDAVPALENTRVQLFNGKNNPGQHGSYDPAKDIVWINIYSPQDPAETLIHETQHAVQDKVGFTQGTNPNAPDVTAHLSDRFIEAQGDLAREPALLKELRNPAADLSFQEVQSRYDQGSSAGLNTLANDSAFSLYEGKAGEVEARDAARRFKLRGLNMTPTEPAATLGAGQRGELWNDIFKPTGGLNKIVDYSGHGLNYKTQTLMTDKQRLGATTTGFILMRAGATPAQAALAVKNLSDQEIRAFVAGRHQFFPPVNSQVAPDALAEIVRQFVGKK